MYQVYPSSRGREGAVVLFLSLLLSFDECVKAECGSQIERTRFVSTEFNSSSMTRSVLTKSRKCTLTSIPTVLHRPGVGLRPKSALAGKTTTQTHTPFGSIRVMMHQLCLHHF